MELGNVYVEAGFFFVRHCSILHITSPELCTIVSYVKLQEQYINVFLGKHMSAASISG